MECFSDPDREVWLICLERDAISDQGAKHHLWAVHEIVHHVFQFGHQSDFVDQVEVYLFIGCYLKPDITFDEKDVASHLWNDVILCPKMRFWINLEEQNRTWRSDNEGLIKQKIHGTEICSSDLLAEWYFWILGVDSKALTLSVEGIDLIIEWTVERFDGEV